GPERPRPGWRRQVPLDQPQVLGDPHRSLDRRSGQAEPGLQELEQRPRAHTDVAGPAAGRGGVSPAGTIGRPPEGDLHPVTPLTVGAHPAPARPPGPGTADPPRPAPVRRATV